MFGHKKINQEIAEIKKVLMAMATLAVVNEQERNSKSFDELGNAVDKIKFNVMLLERIDAIQNYLGIEYDDETKTMKKKETKKCNSGSSQKKK